MTSEAAAPPGRGRRLEVRYVCDLLTRCATGNAPPVPALAIDLSQNGVCLLASQPFEQGSIISFELPLVGGILQATVTQVSPASDGWFKMGCAFAEPLAEGSLDSLWRTKQDRRSGERFQVTSSASYEGHHCCGVATVTDFSKSGLCLLIDHPFPVGTTLRLLIGDCMLEKSVCVVRVNHQEEGVWVCGCSFFQKLTDAEMLRFVEQGSDGGTSHASA